MLRINDAYATLTIKTRQGLKDGVSMYWHFRFICHILSDIMSTEKHWWTDALLSDDDVVAWTTYSGKIADPRWESSSSSMVKPLQFTWRESEGQGK